MNRSEEISLSDKLLKENAFKVQRLEKAYQINHRVKVLKKLEEENKLKELVRRKNSNVDEAVDDVEIIENTDRSNAQQSGSSTRQTDSNQRQSDSSGDPSHPVVAVISASQNGSDRGDDDHDKTISDKVSDADDGSVEEHLQQDNDSTSDIELEKEIENEQPDQTTDQPPSVSSSLI